MNKIYHLANCTTCQAIIEETGIAAKAEEGKMVMQDIKTKAITPAQISALKDMAGSYEALFSRRALKYKAFGLNSRELKEKDYREYILQEYTFLKRPVTVVGDRIFIGNDKKTIASLKAAIAELK